MLWNLKFDFKKFRKGKKYDQIKVIYHGVSGALCVICPN